MTTIQKKYYLFLAFLVFTFLSFGQEASTAKITSFEQGSIAYLFADQVKLRAAPSTSSKVLTMLRIGDRIKIQGATDENFVIAREEMPWYEVRFQGKTGYIPGQFIAQMTANSETARLFFKLNRSTLKVRVINDSHAYTESKIRDVELPREILVKHHKGLQNVQNILVFKQSLDNISMCSGNEYINYYVLNSQNKISHLAEIAQGVGVSEHFTFPYDANGSENKIIFTREETEICENDEDITSHTIVEYKWDGKQLFPAFTRED